MKLSPNFSSGEFVCRDGSSHPIDCGLIAMLQAIRSHVRVPLVITSGYRSPTYNAKIGGAAKSQHIMGNAADFVVPTVDIHSVHEWIDNVFPDCGLGLYVRDGGWGWIHIDNRGYRARWED